MPPEPTAAKRDKPREFRAAGGTAAIRAAEGDAADGKPKLPTFAGTAYTGGPMCPVGWWQPIVIDLAGVKVPSQHRPVLRQHDDEQIVGHTTEVKVGGGIEIAGVFSGERHHVDKVVVPAANGFQWQLSIGADPVRTEFLEPGETTTVNGREVAGPLTISRETVLGEISFVPLGADGDTSATVSASRGRVKAMKRIKAMLKASGKYGAEEIEKMTADEAKAALKKATADDAPATEAEDDEEVDAEDEDPPPPKAKAEDEEDVDAEDEDPPPPKAKAKAKAGKGKSRVSAELTAALQEARNAAGREIRRQDDIRAAVERHGVREVEVGGRKVNLAAHAIEAGWSKDKTELAAIKAARPGAGVGGPLVYSTSGPEVDDAVLEAAVLQAARHEFRLDDDEFYKDAETGARRVPLHLQRDAQRDLKGRYTDRVQQAAHTVFRGRASLQQILVASGRAHGYRGPEVIRDDDAIEQVLRAQNWKRTHGVQADGSSSASIANILSNVLNKFMLQGYLFVEQAWRQITAVRPVGDFKPTKAISLLGDTKFAPVGPDGELKNATLGDQAFANQADQYGRILTLNRKHIINDDLGVLTTAPMKVGQGAGLKLNDVLWTIFLALASATADDGNPFWNSTGDPATHGTPPAGQVAARANLLTGGTSALSSAGLALAKALFDRQVDPNGNPLGFDGVKPILLFPPELWQTAMELVDPSAVGVVYGGGSAARQPNVNLWKGRLDPVMSRYLSNPNYAGNSATAWYTLFNPVALAVIEACFLNGVDTPTVQTAGPDFQFDRLGVSIRGVFDFGVNQQNFRGGVKAAGT